LVTYAAGRLPVKHIIIITITITFIVNASMSGGAGAALRGGAVR
jgi:hypothetical protein